MVPFNASTLIFAAFFLLAIAAVIALLVLVFGWLAPLVSRLTGGVSLRDAVSSPFHRRKRKRDGDEDDDDDDLDDSTATLLSMLPGAAVVVGADGDVVRANPAAYRLGVVSDDRLAVPEISQAVAKVRASGGRITLDVTTATPQWYAQAGDDGSVQRVAGEERSGTVSRPNWLHVTVGRIDERFVVVMLDDVSETIRFQQTRDDFIENVSQQLMKPGRQLQDLADALEAGNLSEEQIAHDARLVRRSSRHVEHLVADLLMLIKAQEPVAATPANRIALADPVRRAVEGEQAEAKERGIEITFRADGDVAVHGDAAQLQAAVAKLVANAVAYSPDGARVSVTVGASKDGSDAVVRVLDRGCGIDPAQQDRIFERFFRGSNQNERTGDGVGLGLAIVKHVALTHHGSVSVWSRPGQGTTFTLLLPRA